MGRMLMIVVAALVVAAGPALVSLQTGTPEAAAQKSSNLADFHGIKTVPDIAKLSFVHKNCRQWAADGDIDIDQTCLVVMTARGGLAAIPNEYAEARDETPAQPGRDDKNGDKWLARFRAIGGGGGI